MLSNSLHLKWIHVPTGEGLVRQHSPRPSRADSLGFLPHDDTETTAESHPIGGGLAPSLLVHCVSVSSPFLGPHLSKSLKSWCPFHWALGLPLTPRGLTISHPRPGRLQVPHAIPQFCSVSGLWRWCPPCFWVRLFPFSFCFFYFTSVPIRSIRGQ